MKLFGYRIMKESAFIRNEQTYQKLYIKYMTSNNEMYNAAFRDGVQHVFENIEQAIKTKNINKVLAIGPATTEQLKMLVNGLLGKFVKKAQ